MRADLRVQRRLYETTLDRAGWAIGVGAMISGGLTAALSAMGAATGPFSLLLAFVTGSVAAALAMTALAMPVWIVMHRRGRRGMGDAALTCAGASFAVCLFAQTYGFGLYAAPPSDAQTLLFRWASAAATSLILGVIGGLIGAIMWRIAYREG